MATYNYIRYFLSEKSKLPILEAAEYEADSRSRHEFLKQELSKNFNFNHSGVNFDYVFIAQEQQFILARIGRPKTEIKLKGPETGFTESKENSWHAVNFIMDISNHNEGQKIALENDSDVGIPLSITKSLASYLNKNIDSNWDITANPITDNSTFWNAAKENRGKITELQLTFVAPNILGGKDKTTEALRTWRDELNMQETQVNFKNADGTIEVDNQSVRDGIDVISKGGGSSKLKSGKKVIYSSQEEDVAVTKTVEKNLDFALVKATINGWNILINSLFPNNRNL